MTLSLEDLSEEKALLEKDFSEVTGSIKKLTDDLNQLKANQHALNGAIQQVNRLISRLNREQVTIEPAVKEKKKWKL